MDRKGLFPEQPQARVRDQHVGQMPPLLGQCTAGKTCRPRGSGQGKDTTGRPVEASHQITGGKQLDRGMRLGTESGVLST